MSKKLYYFLWGIVPVLLSLGCLALYYILKNNELLYPSPTSFSLSFWVLYALSVVIVMIAQPITVGGWFFVWGDDGPPGFFANELSNIFLGLVLWFIIGIVVGFVYKKIRDRLTT